MTSRPNILYIHSHDTGRYIEPYGHAIATPRLQALAEEGVLFRQAFCAAPTCSPSRAALLTGQCAHSSGMLGLAHRGFGLHDVRQHLLYTLRDAGYVSALSGIQHVVPFDIPHTIGYDAYLGDAKAAEQQAAQWLESAPAQPFFLDVGFGETHRNGKADGAFQTNGAQGDGRYCLPPAPFPDTPQTRADMADYKVAARRLDTKIGVVLDALERSGQRDNTLVISTTDHGIPFPNMKCNLTDHGIGVSLIMRGPGDFEGGKVIDGMVSQIDLFPTLCEVIGIEKPRWLQGRSLMPLVRGEADEINSHIFAEVTYHAAYEPKRAVRSRRWKYIRDYNGRGTPMLSNCDGGTTRAFWVENGWLEQPVAPEQLYDLMFDPQETCNLASNAAHAPVLDEMRAQFDGWMRQTDDPLLRGPVAPPSGAIVNQEDAVRAQLLA